MTKMLNDGFDLIANKMNALEGRLLDNDEKIKKFNTLTAKDVIAKEKADKENKKHFLKMQ